MLGGAVEPFDFHQNLRTTEDVGLIDACDEMLQRDVAKYSEMVTHWSSEAKHLGGKRRRFCFVYFFLDILYYTIYHFLYFFGRYEGSLGFQGWCIYIYILCIWNPFHPACEAKGKLLGRNFIRNVGFLTGPSGFVQWNQQLKRPKRGGGDPVDALVLDCVETYPLCL